MKKYQNFTDLLSSWNDCDRPALLYEKEGTLVSLSYRELREAILTEKDRLLPGDRKPKSLTASADPDFIISFFASVLAGIPVLLADPRVPSAVIEETLNRAEKDLYIGNSKQGRGSSNFICVTEEDNMLSGESEGTVLNEDSIEHKIISEGEVLFYTSGTSSRSRCVILTSKSLCCSAWSGQCMLPCGPEDTILCLLPLSHVFGFVCGLLWGLCYGASIALGRGIRHIFDDCMYFHPTILPAVPTIAAALDRMNLFNSELRVLLVGAAPCGEALLESIHKKGIAVYFGYGLTETSSGIAITQDTEEPSAMYACPGADIRIEENGEISVATPCMMKGYLGEASPLVNGRLMTGDLGRMDEEGRLHITGRRKDMLVMPDGTKIFCPEYEAELMQRLETDAIALAEFRSRAVLVIEESALRQKIRQEGTDPEWFRTFQKNTEEVVRHFNASRARSQQIADIIYLKENFPRTAVGKLQRWKLNEILQKEKDQ